MNILKTLGVILTSLSVIGQVTIYNDRNGFDTVGSVRGEPTIIKRHRYHVDTVTNTIVITNVVKEVITNTVRETLAPPPIPGIRLLSVPIGPLEPVYHFHSLNHRTRVPMYYSTQVATTGVDDQTAIRFVEEAIEFVNNKSSDRYANRRPSDTKQQNDFREEVRRYFKKHAPKGVEFQDSRFDHN